LDTSPGNANIIASVTAFNEEQNNALVLGVKNANIAFGSSQTAGSVEAYAGAKDAQTIGFAADLTVASVEATAKISVFGYGLKFGASVNVGGGAKAEIGMTTDITINAILGLTLSVQVVTPNAKQ
jgi:hypothetical protein